MALVLLIAFLAVPVLEIYVIVQVGHVIGVLPTLALLVACSISGAALVRREGARAWRDFSATVSRGGLPTREVADGAMILLGGALLLTPGFVTDLVGLLLVLPPTRALVRLVALRRLTSRWAASPGRSAGVYWASEGFTNDGVVDADVIAGEVIEGEIIEPPETEGR